MKIFEDLIQKYPGIIEKMCFSAISAGSIIMDVYSKNDFGTRNKSDDSPITIADSLSDKVITEALNQNFPNIGIVSEESFCDPRLILDDIYFLVDPLDGTKEFIKKTGEFTVNIALILDKKAELGVVYVPVTKQLYYRDFDGLSYLQEGVDIIKNSGKRSQIRCRPIDTNNLTVVKSVSHSCLETDAYIASYRPKNIVSARSSLKFGWIARGEADLYPRLGRTMEWDTGAAHAVLKGAGGNVRQLDTLEELSYGKIGMDNPFFVACGNDLHLFPYGEGN